VPGFPFSLGSAPAPVLQTNSRTSLVPNAGKLVENFAIFYLHLFLTAQFFQVLLSHHKTRLVPSQIMLKTLGSHQLKFQVNHFMTFSNLDELTDLHVLLE
jgi:hypothetical protein